MKRALITVLLISFSVAKIAYAAPGDDVNGGEMVPTEEGTSADNSMISQHGEISGYMELWVGDQKLDATYLAEQLGKQYGSVLILPDSGGDIDSKPTVHELRHGLIRRGWSVMTLSLHFDDVEPNIYLSVNDPSVSAAVSEGAGERTSSTEDENADEEQQPAPVVMEDETATPAADSDNQPPSIEQENGETPEIEPPANQHRLAAALNYLKTQSEGAIVIIAIGEAVSELHSRMPEIPEGIGIIWINVKTPITELADVKLLDIVAYAPGRNNQLADDRQALMKRENKTSYLQRRIMSSDPQLIGSEAILIATIKGWLQKNFEPQDSK